MTLQQRRLILLLASANVIFLGALLLVATSSGGLSFPLSAPTPVPTYRPPARLASACRERAVQMIADSGLTGTVLLKDQTLHLDLVYRLTEGQPPEDAAQQAWTAFDIALGLADGGCEGFSRIETVIETQHGPERLRIYASIDLANLKAYHAGELSEQAFIERVEYRVERMDPDAL